MFIEAQNIPTTLTPVNLMLKVYFNSFPLLRKVDQTLKVNIIYPKADNLQ